MIQFQNLKNIELKKEFDLKVGKLNLENIELIGVFSMVCFVGLLFLDFTRFRKGILFENPIYYYLFINHFSLLLLIIPYHIIRKNKTEIKEGKYQDASKLVLFFSISLLVICLPMAILSIMDRGSIVMYAVFILCLNFIIQLSHKDRIYFNLISVFIVGIAIFILNLDNKTQLIISILEVLGMTIPAFLVATSRFNDQIIQFENEEELVHRSKETDALLLNILPEQIAEELKQNGYVSPKYYESVSILFTDIVNFSKLSEERSPEQLAIELDKCFRQFDRIIKRHGLEKIKTIGDAYMCVSGLPIEDENHAIKMIKAAKEMKKWLEIETGKGNQFANMRIGIHSGAVVAGVVGEDKFAYDIWGKSVNIAARIENAGEALKINISEATYHLIKENYPCDFRGEIKVKNMGEINMYFLKK